MRKIFITAIAVQWALWMPVAGSASVAGKAFNGVEFGQSPEVVIERIQGGCESLETVRIDPPVIPVARQDESHVLCRNYEADGVGKIEEIAFTFGDQSLSLIEARGGAVASLSALSESDPQEFRDYEVYFDDLLVTKPDEGAAWLLTQESVFPHMFLWRNPLLSANASAAHTFDPSARIPSVLKFGESIETLAPVLDESCEMTRQDEIEQIWLPNHPGRQTQINCYGYDYAGFTRKIEAVFGDGILQLAWILAGSGEEDRLRQALIAAYGPAISDNGTYEVFADGRVALRKDKPEILILSEELVPLYLEEFGSEP